MGPELNSEATFHPVAQIVSRDVRPSPLTSQARSLNPKPDGGVPALRLLGIA